MIGVVGSIDSLAGLDICRHIVENKSQVSFILASMPTPEVDKNPNPAAPIAKIITKLEKLGAQHIGIASSTVHTLKIFGKIEMLLLKRKSTINLVNMVDETIKAIKCDETITSIGILCESGTYQTNLYHQKLTDAGLKPIFLEFGLHHTLIHNAIYNPVYGIDVKGGSNTKAIFKLNKAIKLLEEQGAQAIILGSTTLSLVETKLKHNTSMVYNPLTCLAQALISRAQPP